MRIVCLSDTHMQHAGIDVPDGDVLVHTGDATWMGTFGEVARFCAWFGSFPHKHKVFVPGNHDWLFQRDPDIAKAMTRGFVYLNDSGAEIAGLKFWGSPWQPEFGSWAFNLPRGHELRSKWQMIPADTDVLLTHGPPKKILDITRRGENVGCDDLRYRVASLPLKLHVFGHIHPAYGQVTQADTIFVNASICNEEYKPVNQPIVVEL